MNQTTETICPDCGQPLEDGQLLCPNCGSAKSRYGQLQQLTAEAFRLESINPPAAANVWRQVLALLPPQSPQFQQVQNHLGMLASGQSMAVPRSRGILPLGQNEIPRPAAGTRPVRPPDPPAVAVAKTVGSMLISIAVYYFLAFDHNWPIAIGFVVLMLIHEMGHVLATWYYGLSASPPIFIPFIGALINLRQSPPNAWVESVVGMGGPFLGTIGALCCYALAFVFPPSSALRIELLVVSQLGFFLNLFNLLPVPPLDGGRITAAISPWLWLLGLIGLGALMFFDVRTSGAYGLFIPVLILVYALPRIRHALAARGSGSPYYKVPKAKSWAMGSLYVVLASVLAFMFLHLGGFRVFASIG